MDRPTYLTKLACIEQELPKLANTLNAMKITGTESPGRRCCFQTACFPYDSQFSEGNEYTVYRSYDTPRTGRTGSETHTAGARYS